jgi:hypothetical protein
MHYHTEAPKVMTSHKSVSSLAFELLSCNVSQQHPPICWPAPHFNGSMERQDGAWSGIIGGLFTGRPDNTALSIKACFVPHQNQMNPIRLVQIVFVVFFHFMLHVFMLDLLCIPAPSPYIGQHNDLGPMVWLMARVGPCHYAEPQVREGFAASQEL